MDCGRETSYSVNVRTPNLIARGLELRNCAKLDITVLFDRMLNRFLMTVSAKDCKVENEEINVSPLSSTPRSRVMPDGDEVRHVRSSSGLSETSIRSLSSMETSQSLGSYKSQTSLDDTIALHLELDKTYEKSLRKRQAELNRTRSSSLNEKGSVADPRLSITADARSASFSGTTEDMGHYPTRANRPMFRSDYSINSPGNEQRTLITGSNTEVMLLHNKTLVLKNLTKPEEADGFDGSYLDQMSVSDGLNDMASIVSRNDRVRDMGTSVDEINKKFPRKAYSRSASSASSSFTPRGKRLKKSVTSMSIWSLQSVPMSPTSPADVESIDMMPIYTSFRDAHGYSALSNLRRQRSINRDIESRIGGFNQSFAIVGYVC